MKQEFLFVEPVLSEEERIFEENCSRVAEIMGDFFEELVWEYKECIHGLGTDERGGLVPRRGLSFEG